MADRILRSPIASTILVFDRSELHLADLLGSRSNPDGQMSIFVHFKGWSSRFDGWVDISRAVPFTDENKRRFEFMKTIEDTQRKGFRTRYGLSTPNVTDNSKTWSPSVMIQKLPSQNEME